MGRLADLSLPGPLRRPVLGTFARVFGIAVDEAARPLEAYPTLNAFFTRRLRPGIRSWPPDPGAAGSPVDGIVGTSGEIRSGLLLQAKGRRYAVGDLADDPEAGRRFDGGRFLTVYLSPRHYHRIHAPTSGTITEGRHVPGALLPVNPPAVLHYPDLFPRNERIVVEVHGPLGRVAVVAVGAYNVGWISTAFDPEWRPPPGRGPRHRTDGGSASRRWDPPIPVRRGDEIMAFHLGSTVVVLFEPGVALSSWLAPGREIRLGDRIAGPGPAAS